MIIDGMHYSEDCSCPSCREMTARHEANKRVLKKETMNEPQLSAEMERIKDHCQCKHCVDGAIHSSDCAVHNEPADENGECNCEAVYISVFSEDLSYYWNWWFGDGWTNDKDKYHLFLLVKKELATALEEQRAKYISNVSKLKLKPKLRASVTNYNKAIDDVLNQLKEEGKQTNHD